MKNLFMVISAIGLFLSFFGCFDGSKEHNPLEDISIGQKDDYVCDNNIDLKNISKISYYVHSTIGYKDDVADYWQLPEETLNLKTGDCEDFCILWMYLAKTKFNIDSYLAIVRNGSECHALIYGDLLGDGNLYYEDPTTNSAYFSSLPNGWSESCKIPYNEVIWMTYYYHNNVGKYY